MPPSARPYMGAIPRWRVTFRVWAPFASAVQVQEDFNNRQPGSPLYSEGNGYWSVGQGGTVVGQQYNYLITNAATGAVLTHVDPYSRSFKTRGGPNLIAPSDIPHPDASYTTPSFPEAEILRRAQIS
jgi:1,4-alpha-glucan branching enzyme